MDVFTAFVHLILFKDVQSNFNTELQYTEYRQALYSSE